MFSGDTEAVFSSSGDRIRANHAKTTVAGPGIVSAEVRSGVSRIFARLAQNLFTVLFPSDCRLCGEPLAKVSRLPVCHDCLDGIRHISGGVCEVCGERLFSTYASSLERNGGELRCGLCQRIEPPYVRAAAYGSYDGGLRELIHLLKYASVRPAANVLGRMLAEAIADLEIAPQSEPMVVIPVPLHRAKFRQREFNHAALIARAAIKVSPMRASLWLCEGGLERRRETPSQTGLTRHQRRENVRGAFGVLQPEAVKGRQVLVVDDVFTTGATVSECARVLRRAGAARVWVATVARTLKVQEQQVEIPMPGERGSEARTTMQEIALARAVGS